MLPQATSRPAKVPRIGYLTYGSVESEKTWLAAFRQGLGELGYVDGESIAIEQREAAGQPERLPEPLAELLSLNVDVLVVAGSQAIRAAKEATSTIPIVMVGAGDPARTGLVSSLAHPGGNLTGTSDLHSGIITKRFELLKDVVPLATRVAILRSMDAPEGLLQLEDIQAAAQRLGVTLLPVQAKGPDDIEPAFATIREGRIEALFIIGTRFFVAHLRQIADLTLASGLPSTYTQRQWVELAGLMSFGSKTADLYRRTAYFVDKILKGTKPADLPVEQPTTFDFVINLKTAQALGITIPQFGLAAGD